MVPKMCKLPPKPWFTMLYCFLFGGRGLYHISYHHDIPMIFRWYPIVYHHIIFVSLPVLIPIWVADVWEELDVAQPILQDLVRALTWVTSDRLMDFQRRVMMVTQSQLVGGLEHEFYFPIYWEFHHPFDYSYIFQRGRSTTNLAIQKSVVSGLQRNHPTHSEWT